MPETMKYIFSVFKKEAVGAQIQDIGRLRQLGKNYYPNNRYTILKTLLYNAAVMHSSQETTSRRDRILEKQAGIIAEALQNNKIPGDMTFQLQSQTNILFKKVILGALKLLIHLTTVKRKDGVTNMWRDFPVETIPELTDV